MTSSRRRRILPPPGEVNKNLCFRLLNVSLVEFTGTELDFFLLESLHLKGV